MIAITSYFKGELQPFKKESSDKAKDASHNSNNSKATNALQYNNEFDQNLTLFRMSFFGAAAHPSLKSVTHILQ